MHKKKRTIQEGKNNNLLGIFTIFFIIHLYTNIFVFNLSMSDSINSISQHSTVPKKSEARKMK